jgi:hypothetical protein
MICGLQFEQTGPFVSCVRWVQLQFAQSGAVCERRSKYAIVQVDYNAYRVGDCIWNVMAHAQKPHLVFRRNVRVHLNRRGRQFSRLLTAEVCASALVMLDTPCSEVMWRVLATHSIHQFPPYFPSRASPCAITFQLDSTAYCSRSSRAL